MSQPTDINPKHKDSILIMAFTGLFLVLVLLNQMQNHAHALWIMFGLLLSISFFKEKYRFLIWVILAYELGEILFMYSVRFTDLLSLPIHLKILLNRMLNVCYIIPILLVFAAFKTKWRKYFRLPNRDVPIGMIGRFSLSLPFLLGAGIAAIVIPLLPSILANKEFITSSLLIFGLLFSLVNTFMQEGIWRVLLLTAFRLTGGKITAFLATGLGFGLTHLSLGFSPIFCICFSIAGGLLSALTDSVKSIIPSGILYFTLNLTLILAGDIYLGI